MAGSWGDESGLEVAAGFAERLLEVIDSGRRTATYKLALLMSLLDLCARRGGLDGRPPSVLYTREIAERVAAIYWPQMMPYRRGSGVIELRQITLPRSAITGAVLEFRRAAEATGVTSLSLARQRLAGEYARMLDRVEVAVAEQPLPRLQTVGSSEQVLPFLYDIGWGPRESFSPRRLRRAGPAGLPVRLRPGAGEQLVRLAPLIRPLVELHWTQMVATINRVATEEQELHRHLFGRDRLAPPKALREGLAGLQAGRCFYCRQPFRRTPEADHFIPRVRCGIDAVENLVLADSSCNNDKRDLLPAPPLVDAWSGRNREHEDALAQLASACGWDSDPEGTLAVARSIYRHLPAGLAPFWRGTGNVDITHVRPGFVVEII
ncbi:MAG TPA: HNH endonuclease [Streptosporangiaceae bacterium]